MGDRRPFTSPSDLAEYAYCPRARFYRHEYGAPEPTPAALAGVRFHRAELSAVRRRETYRAVYVAVALAGVALLLLAVAVLVQ